MIQHAGLAVGKVVSLLLTGVVGWEVAQSIVDTVDVVERVVAGSVVLGAVVLIVRFMLQADARVKENWSRTMVLANEERDRAYDRIIRLEQKVTELEIKYERERDLRLGLEAQGLIDRRDRGIIE